MTAADHRCHTFARALVDIATTRPFLNALLVLKRQHKLHERMRVTPTELAPVARELADAA